MAALKLFYYLGIRSVFLLGCDFHMSSGNTHNYAFEQARSKRSVRHNNNIYRNLNEMFLKLLPFFKEHGFEVFNCTPNSSLTAFPYVEFDQALKIATINMTQLIDTAGMYEQRTKKT